jgi:hypothetical protein
VLTGWSGGPDGGAIILGNVEGIPEAVVVGDAVDFSWMILEPKKSVVKLSVPVGKMV